MMRKLIATFLGIGRIPGWAGTYASAVTAALALGAYQLGAPWWSLVAAAAVVTVVAIAVGQSAEQDFGAKDPRPFVLDEVAGMLIAAGALWLPQSDVPWWATTVLAFFWFRVTDTLKPPPARQLERLPGGWGIVMDDVAAGAMALGLTVVSLLVAARLR
jgi:phosphatidylglycerophosphatase A